MHEELDSYFGEGITLKGVIRFKGVLRVDCDFEGEIQTEDTLIIGNTANISADINAGALFNMGRINGDVRASKKVSLLAGSQLNGNINSPLLVVEKNAFFDGSCTMPDSPSAGRTVGGKDLKLQKALAEPYRGVATEFVEKAPAKTAGVVPSWSEIGKRVMAAKAMVAAVASFLLLGTVTAYFFHVSKNEIRGSRLSRSVYEKSAQNDAEKLMKIGLTYMEEDDYENSTRVYRRLKELLRGDKDVSLKLAQSLAMSGEEDEAITYFEEAFEAYPDDKKIIGTIRSYYTAKNDIQKLIELQELIVARNPADKDAVALLFDLYKNSNRLEEALSLYRSSLTSSPITASDYLTTGRLEKSMDRLKKATDTFKKAVSADTKNLESRIELAYAYHKAGLEYKAAREFRVVARIAPDHVEALNNKGFTNLKQGRMDRALEFFNMAQSHDKNNLRSWLGLATTYSRLGKGKMAEHYCRKILALDPDYSPALNRLAWIYAQENRNLEEAKKYSFASMKYYNGLPEYLDTLSEIHYKNKEYKKAVTYMEYAIKARPRNKYFRQQMKKFRAATKSKESTAKPTQKTAIKPEETAIGQKQSVAIQNETAVQAAEVVTQQTKDAQAENEAVVQAVEIVAPPLEGTLQRPD